ncbi:MAG: LacI family DNA-binding transcriptional regulator [Hyphomicrobiales bacterium]|jgi:LacI family transcriptional regulator
MSSTPGTPKLPLSRQQDPADAQSAPGSSTVDLRALAQHLGLSKGTISRALNGYPEIADRTRARVLQAAAELGYKPNRAARRLATGRNELVGYIGVGSDWMTVERSFLGALSTTLASRGYGLMVSLADTMAHAEATMQQLIEDRRCDGFVLSAAFPSDARIALALKHNVPAAIIGGASMRSSHTAALPTIGIQDSSVLDGLVDYLNSLGHESFAYFGCDAPQTIQTLHSETLAASCGNRNALFVRSIRSETEAAESPSSLTLQTETAASLTERATRILDTKPSGPTAVFCGCERTVVALYMAARDRGLSVPEELSIIGIGSSQLASWLSGGLSTVSWSLSEAGRLAADCVLAQVEGTASPDLNAGIEAEFLARSSHGPAPRIL